MSEATALINRPRHELRMDFIPLLGEWFAKCNCGWVSVDRHKRKMLAELDYAEHFKKKVPEE